RDHIVRMLTMPMEHLCFASAGHVNGDRHIWVRRTLRCVANGDLVRRWRCGLPCKAESGRRKSEDGEADRGEGEREIAYGRGHVLSPVRRREAPLRKPGPLRWRARGRVTAV